MEAITVQASICDHKMDQGNRAREAQTSEKGIFLPPPLQGVKKIKQAAGEERGREESLKGCIADRVMLIALESVKEWG